LDPNKGIHQGIQEALSNNPRFEIVGSAIEGADGLRKVTALRPHILITEYALPKLDGFTVTSQIKALDDEIKVILFTDSSYLDLLPEVFKVPISGYIRKNRPMEELIRAIRVVSEGGSYFSEDVLRYWAHYLLKGERPDYFDTLTLREKEVFQLIVGGHSVGQIAGQLRISPKTVETHRSNIAKKLGIRSQTDWKKEAIRKGYSKVPK
jgi:DNA-binding NarL/FixJ family response regulator